MPTPDVLPANNKDGKQRLQIGRAMGESKPTHSERCCEYCGRPLAPCVVEFGGRRIVAGFRECDCEARAGRGREPRRPRPQRKRRAWPSAANARESRSGSSARPSSTRGLLDYLESFEGSAGRGLYIYGSVGRGKSYSAAALGERLRGRGLSHGVHDGVGDAREDQGELFGERRDRAGRIEVHRLRRPRHRRPRQRGRPRSGPRT